MEISLIIPAYNEEKRICDTITAVLSFLSQHFKEYEVLVVDDGSSDLTLEVLNSFEDKHLRIISVGENQGKGQVIKLGMEHAVGKYIFFTDADLPYRLESILAAVDAFEQRGSYLVIGSRDMYREKPDMPYPVHRKIMSKTFALIINIILALGITDTQCGFKAFTFEAAKSIFPLVTINGFGFDFEVLFIARRLDMAIDCIPVNLSYSSGSKVHIVRDSLKMLRDAFLVRINDWKGLYGQKPLLRRL